MNEMPNITCVVAMTKDRVIGKGDQLPWHIPEEFKNFKEFTKGKTILMGRRTYEGMGRALPKRRNLMLARSHENVQVGEMKTVKEGGIWKCVGEKGEIEIYPSPESVLDAISADEEFLVLGGGEIYRIFMEYPDVVLRVSEIHDEYEGDVYFPEFKDRFEEFDREPGELFDVVWYRKK